MVIDHICFAVKDLRKAIENWSNVFGYRQMTEVVANSRQQVHVVFLTKENSITIKLIEPFKENQSVRKFVSKGGGFHHLCFKCSNLEEKMDELNGKGLITLVAPQPGEAFENENIVFMLTRFGLSLELIDTDKKAKLIQ